jgi:hypothetical protein
MVTLSALYFLNQAPWSNKTAKTKLTVIVDQQMILGASLIKDSTVEAGLNNIYISLLEAYIFRLI